jgi:hypothetical protein
MRILLGLQITGLIVLHDLAAARGQVVTSTNASGAGSLREVISAAPPGAVVTFAPELSGATFLCNAAIAINKELAIDGAGLAKAPIIEFNTPSTNLLIGAEGRVTLANLEIKNDQGAAAAVLVNGGKLTGQKLRIQGNSDWTGRGAGIQIATNATAIFSDCGIFAHGGGGVNNAGSLSATNCSFSSNPGSGFWNVAGASALLADCTVSENGEYGAGIHNNGALTLIGGSVTANQNWQGENAYEGDGGGGIWNGENGTLAITNTVISGNRSFMGGGINNEGKIDAHHLRLEGNSYPNDVLEYGYGAAIWSAKGDISMTDCAVVGNQSSESGGIFKLAGDLTLIRTIVSSNLSVALPSPNTDCQGGVGAAISSAAGRVKLVECTVSANQAPGLFCVSPDGNTSNSEGGAGGIHVRGDLEIYRSTISSNVGNGIAHSGGTAIVVQSTITGNAESGEYLGTFSDYAVAGGLGGGVLSLGILRTTNCTIFGNIATGPSYPTPRAAGGGIYFKGTEFSLQNSIVCGNQADLSSNIFGAFTGSNNLVDVDPGLAGLANNGGGTETMLPAEGSAAIDGGAYVGLAMDQRGFAGLVSLFPDIGAVETGVVRGLQFSSRFEADGGLVFEFRGAAGARFKIYTTRELDSGEVSWELAGSASEAAVGSGVFRFGVAFSRTDGGRFFAIVPEGP